MRNSEYPDDGGRDTGVRWSDGFDLAVRRLMTAIVVADGLIGLAIYASDDSPPRYQVTAADGRIIRVNTRTGTVIACQERRCAVVLERGQDLDDELPTIRIERDKAEEAPALPPPSADNAASPPPVTAPAEARR